MNRIFVPHLCRYLVQLTHQTSIPSQKIQHLPLPMMTRDGSKTSDYHIHLIIWNILSGDICAQFQEITKFDTIQYCIKSCLMVQCNSIRPKNAICLLQKKCDFYLYFQCHSRFLFNKNTSVYLVLVCCV